MCTDRDFFQHFKQLTAHNTHVWLMLLFLQNMAQQTYLDAMVFVFLQALDFLHQSNYIKNGDSIPLWFTWSSICAWMCNHSRWGVPSNSTINHAELCLKLCPISIHFHPCFAVLPWGCFQVSPKIFSFCGMKDDWREDLDDKNDDWWWLTQLFFAVIYRCCHWYTVDRRMLKQENIFFEAIILISTGKLT